MDRPEWLAIDPLNQWVYCTLTYNNDRGKPGVPGADAANPRELSEMGHIIRWKEDRDFDATTFRWNHLVLAGNPASERPQNRGKHQGRHLRPPGRARVRCARHAVDPDRLLGLGAQQGRFRGVRQQPDAGVRPASGETRRFLSGPINCEITGAAWTPDGRTMFVNIQHPGETPSERSDPAGPAKFSNWPDFQPGGRPRSATVVMRKLDGGVIGT